MLSKVEWGKVEDSEDSEASMKGFAINFSITDCLIGERGEKTVGVKVFSVEDCREKILMIKDKIESVDSFGGEAQERR